MRSAPRRRSSRTRHAVPAVTALALAIAGMALPAGAQSSEDASQVGRFQAPFVEPRIGETTTDEKCIEREDGSQVCKPAAGSIAVLPDGNVVYWSALEATENIALSTVAEFGRVAENDQTRHLDLSGAAPVWTIPTDSDGGAQPRPEKALIDGSLIDNGGERNANGALFGSDQVFLADGRLLTASGTDYYNEFGAVELEGLVQTRIYDGATNGWTQTGDLNIGRWYPTLVTTGSGEVYAFSGVTKLIKPVYSDNPTASGRNVPEPEVYDPATGTWRLLDAGADRSLPLYPRMRLLPNGNIVFATSGQSWNPAGYAYDEALWNITATFDPETGTWSEHEVPGLGTLDIGYRGSGSTVMLTLRPDETGRYANAELLNTGGVAGTSPGGLVGLPFTRITAVDIAEDGSETVSSRAAADLNATRWYGHSTLLPSGEVLLTSGGDTDDVVAPGGGRPRLIPELYDPATDTWTQMTSQSQPRTYHNSAVLLPDATVLVGGHNPIPTGYTTHFTIPGNAPNDGRDPSFEIFEPPYLHRGDRPVIVSAPTSVDLNQQATLTLDIPADQIRDVVAMRHAAETHIIDGDQRAVELTIVSRDGNDLVVRVPDTGNVLPAGPYMIFVNKDTDDGPIPSEAALVSVTSNVVADGTATESAPEPAATDAPASEVLGEQLPATGGGLAAALLGIMGAAVLRRRS